MNIEAYDLDSLRLLVRKLEKENKLLKQKFMNFHVPFKVERFIEIIRSRQEKGVKVTVLTTDPSSSLYGDTNFLSTILDKMRQSGIYVYTKEEVDERFAVIDDQLVWHGSVNLLGKEDIWDNLMRIHHYQVASELLEIAFGNSKRGKENVD